MSSKRSNKKQSPIITIVTLAVVIIAVFITRFTSNDENITADRKAPVGDGILAVHFLDVGQGDCEFIELPDGRCMLIDASEREYSSQIIETIDGFGYSKIDYVVGTHPHTDHIGGLADVIESFAIGEIYMPRASSNSKTFEYLLNTISDNGLKINTAVSGKSIYSDDEMCIELLAPVSESYEDTNNYSAVVKITYGENAFLFTGDAEKPAENEMLDNDYESLDCDIIKVGHHGSNTSSSIDFLEAVSPCYAVISCGEGNSYGHPHKEPLHRLASVGAEVYRTDLDGTVTIICDGKNGFEVNTEK